ncbi:MAG: ABC transporter substrate-binding protein [Hyphomicrobium sp.]
MVGLFRGIAAALVALALVSGIAPVQGANPKITIAVGGEGCLCYLPAVLAEQLGEFDKAGVDVEMVSFSGGSQALTALLAAAQRLSRATTITASISPARGQALTSFVVYNRYPGYALVVAPNQQITSIKDLAGKKIGVSAPGSSTDFFLKYILAKNGVDPNSVAIIGVGVAATAVAAMEYGSVDAAIMIDPAITILESRYPDLTILDDTRTQQDTLDVFGGEYPGGALYARTDWLAKNEATVQALTNAMVATLDWMESHTPEEIMAQLPDEIVGPDKALYLAALKHSMPMFSTTGLMDPKGAEAVLAVFSQSVPEVAAAHIDLSKTYTNRFVEAADTGTATPAQ